MSTESRRAMSVKAGSFTESVIREMTRLSDLYGAMMDARAKGSVGSVR